MCNDTFFGVSIAPKSPIGLPHVKTNMWGKQTLDVP